MVYPMNEQKKFQKGWCLQSMNLQGKTFFFFLFLLLSASVVYAQVILTPEEPVRTSTLVCSVDRYNDNYAFYNSSGLLQSGSSSMFNCVDYNNCTVGEEYYCNASTNSGEYSVSSNRIYNTKPVIERVNLTYEPLVITDLVWCNVSAVDAEGDTLYYNYVWEYAQNLSNITWQPLETYINQPQNYSELNLTGRVDYYQLVRCTVSAFDGYAYSLNRSSIGATESGDPFVFNYFTQFGWYWHNTSVDGKFAPLSNEYFVLNNEPFNVRDSLVCSQANCTQTQIQLSSFDSTNYQLGAYPHSNLTSNPINSSITKVDMGNELENFPLCDPSSLFPFLATTNMNVSCPVQIGIAHSGNSADVGAFRFDTQSLDRSYFVDSQFQPFTVKTVDNTLPPVNFNCSDISHIQTYALQSGVTQNNLVSVQVRALLVNTTVVDITALSDLTVSAENKSSFLGIENSASPRYLLVQDIGTINFSAHYTYTSPTDPTDSCAFSAWNTTIGSASIKYSRICSPSNATRWAKFQFALNHSKEFTLDQEKALIYGFEAYAGNLSEFLNSAGFEKTSFDSNYEAVWLTNKSMSFSTFLQIYLPDLDMRYLTPTKFISENIASFQPHGFATDSEFVTNFSVILSRAKEMLVMEDTLSGAMHVVTYSCQSNSSDVCNAYISDTKCSYSQTCFETDDAINYTHYEGLQIIGTDEESAKQLVCNATTGNNTWIFGDAYGVITGQVNDTLQKPLAGAQVDLAYIDDSTNIVYVKKTTTGADGYYSFGYVYPKEYTVFVSKPNYEPQTTRVIVEPDTRYPVNFILASIGCNADCSSTTSGGKCVSTCHGLNGCLFYSNSSIQGTEFGRLLEQVGAYAGQGSVFLESINKTVNACEGVPDSGSKTLNLIAQAQDKSCADGSTLLTPTYGAIVDGQAYTVVVAICRQN